MLFPARHATRDVPTDNWHADAPYGLPVRPLPQLKLFTLLTDLESGGGGTMLVAGSHHVMARFGDIDGVRVRVVELTGRAGDVVLVHPSVLHARPVNCHDTSRFMLVKDIPARGAP